MFIFWKIWRALFLVTCVSRFAFLPDHRLVIHFIHIKECFNSPYGVNYFAEYAEKENDEATKSLSQMAKEFSVHLVAGSIPEEENGKYYNTCFVYNASGRQIGKFRKVSILFLSGMLGICMLTGY